MRASRPADRAVRALGADTLFALARSVVRGRGHVGKLDARAGRGVGGAFSGYRRRTLFRRMLRPRGRGTTRRGSDGGDADDPARPPRIAARDFARPQPN